MRITTRNEFEISMNNDAEGRRKARALVKKFRKRGESVWKAEDALSITIRVRTPFVPVVASPVKDGRVLGIFTVGA